MGNLKYFSLLMAAGMFAACSDNLENAGNGNDGPKTGEGYVKVAINLPSVSSSRATDGSSVNLDDGVEKEYAVKNGIIAFFEQAKASATDPDDEKDAKFVKAYYMSLTFNEKGPDDDHVTSTTGVIQTLNAPMLSNANNQMYALVILNNGKNNSIVSVDNGGESLSFKNGSDGNTPIILEPGSTIDGLYGNWLLNAGNITSDENGFLMLNSPLYNSGNVQTLVPVTVSSDPNNAETANIYVERVVAKVDVSINTSSSDYFTETSGEPSSTKSGLSVKKDGSIYTGDKVVFVDTNDGAEPLGWTLNVTNKNTKPLRDVSDVTTWDDYDYADFIGNTSTDISGFARIYWAKDNNYDATATDFNVYNTKENKLPATWGGYSSGVGTVSETIAPQYCLENTAPAASVKDNNTTAVLIKATYWVDGIDAADKSFFMIGDDAATVNTSDFLERVKNTLDPDGLASTSLESLAIADVDGGYYTGATELRSLISNIPANSETNSYDDKLASLGTIRYYKDGGCYYYAVPIKHFTITKPSGTIEDSNFLGAYGVVRNNWYQITINSVSGPGAPEITDPGDEGVEDEEAYIKCSINVLSWAKRTQGVEL